MAGPTDFTGQTISESYQRVLQISSSGELTDGTGSIVILGSSAGISTASFAISASYAISASHEITYELSSSFAETASYVDSSTLDTFKQTGHRSGDSVISGSLFISGSSITASGDISSSGTISGSNIVKSFTNGGTNNVVRITLQDGTNKDVTVNNVANADAVPYTGLTGTATIWNQNTTGNAATAGCSDRVKTRTCGSSGEQYVTFVDNNNASAECEDVKTAPFLRVNCEKRAFIVEGKIISKGSSITLESGSISASGNITASGDISSSGFVYSKFVSAGSITASGDISMSGAGSTLTTTTGSFNHIITDGDTIEFRNAGTGNKEGTLKFDSSNGLQVGDSSAGSANLKAKTITAGEKFISDGSAEFQGNVTMSGAFSASGAVMTSKVQTNGMNSISPDVYNNVPGLQFGSDSHGSRLEGKFVSIGIPGTTATALTASGKISSSGAISAPFITALDKTSMFSEVIVTGTLTAQKYIVSSSVTYLTQSFSSGSTMFGDSADDTHIFTGDITASNDISASGTLIGGALQITPADTSDNNDHLITFQKLGNNITNVTDGFVINPSNDKLTLGGNITFHGSAGHITASGQISSSGTGENYFGGDINVKGANIILDNNQKIQFKHNTSGAEFGNVFMNTSNHMVFQNNKSGGDVHIKAGNSGTQGNVTIMEGGGSTVIAKFGENNSLDLTGNLTASGDISASGNIYMDQTTGTDNSVVVMDATGKLVTDEIDPRVWGTTLLDGTNGTNNEIAIFTDPNSVEGDGNLTFNGSVLSVKNYIESNRNSSFPNYAIGGGHGYQESLFYPGSRFQSDNPSFAKYGPGNVSAGKDLICFYDFAIPGGQQIVSVTVVTTNPGNTWTLSSGTLCGYTAVIEDVASVTCTTLGTDGATEAELVDNATSLSGAQVAKLTGTSGNIAQLSARVKAGTSLLGVHFRLAQIP